MSMQDVLQQVYNRREINEIYEIVFTTELVTDRGTYRLEILRTCNERQSYSANVFERVNASVQDAEAYEIKDRQKTYTNPTREVQFYAEADLPWVDCDTAEDALLQALGFFEDRYTKAKPEE